MKYKISKRGGTQNKRFGFSIFGAIRTRFWLIFSVIDNACPMSLCKYQMVVFDNFQVTHHFPFPFHYFSQDPLLFTPKHFIQRTGQMRIFK